MAYVLEVFIVDPGDQTIKVSHSFYGLSEQECRTYLREHQANDEYLAAAVREGRALEELDEVDEEELPDPEDLEEDEEDEEEDD